MDQPNHWCLYFHIYTSSGILHKFGRAHYAQTCVSSPSNSLLSYNTFVLWVHSKVLCVHGKVLSIHGKVLSFHSRMLFLLHPQRRVSPKPPPTSSSESSSSEEQMRERPQFCKESVTPPKIQRSIASIHPEFKVGYISLPVALPIRV
jgi:hypothetical protein